MWHVVLEEDELLMLREAASAIEESKRGIPTADWGVDSLESRFLSLCAERCVAKVLGCRHEVRVLPSGDGGIDLVLPVQTRFGRTVEVKFRRSRKTDLATQSIRFWEELVADIFVLVWPAGEQGWAPEHGFTLVGFATKADFHQRIVARPPIRMRGEKWEIPWQDLRPIELLVEEVTRGTGLAEPSTYRGTGLAEPSTYRGTDCHRGEIRGREDDAGRGTGDALRRAA